MKFSRGRSAASGANPLLVSYVRCDWRWPEGPVPASRTLLQWAQRANPDRRDQALNLQVLALLLLQLLRRRAHACNTHAGFACLVSVAGAQETAISPSPAEDLATGEPVPDSANEVAEDLARA